MNARQQIKATRTRRVVVAALVAFAGGARGGAVSADALANDTAPAAVESEATPVDLRTARSDTPTCSIYDIPSLETAVVARASLVNGSPYVIVCENGSRREALNQAFVFEDPSR